MMGRLHRLLRPVYDWAYSLTPAARFVLLYGVFLVIMTAVVYLSGVMA